MDIRVGDMVQIKNNGLDITTGMRAISNSAYGEGGPLWATVELIDDNYHTGGRFDLPLVITRVICVSPYKTIIWQVQPEDIAENIIRSSDPSMIQRVSNSPDYVPGITDIGLTELGNPMDKSKYNNNAISSFNGENKNEPYVTIKGAENWSTGVRSVGTTTGHLHDPKNIEVPIQSHSPFTVQDVDYYESIGVNHQDILAKKSILSISDPGKRRTMLNDDIENIQNAEGYPIKTKDSYNLKTAKYDYRIQVGNINEYKMTNTLEDKLMEARASLGIPVHGNLDTARAMKYFMYNRFKTPDTNMAHSKSITHVFFTRPDLNLLNPKGGANSQTINHSESAVLWRRNPDLFKLLTSHKRCGDSDDFNLLLSNQVTSFEIQDENLSTTEAGKSWGHYEMLYGDTYSGRSAGEFSCNFTETNDYSIIKLIKLWITYIDNVSRGAWLPSYNLQGEGVSLSPTASHIYSKTLDYASSCYVFKCGPDGEDVLYWSKYFGIFPINTGASALSWELGANIGDSPKLNIRFKYSFKRDCSPISLLEFNNISNVIGGSMDKYENSFNVNYAHSSRPYVGSPFIEMNLSNNPVGFPTPNGVSDPRGIIRLKFRKGPSNNKLNDKMMYRASISE